MSANTSKSSTEKRSDLRAYRRARPAAARAAEALVRALRNGATPREVARRANDALMSAGDLWEAASRMNTR